MVYLATPSPSISLLLLCLLGLLLLQRSSTSPLSSCLQAAESFHISSANRSSATCSHGSWSELTTNLHNDNLDGVSCPFLDGYSSNLSQKKEEITADEPSFGSLRVSGQVSDEFIVRFTSYKHASEHKKALEVSLQWLSGWKWIDRVNAASAFPTDFALLKVEEAAQHSILQELKRLEFVKDFSPQSRFWRALLNDSEIHARKESATVGLDEPLEMGNIYHEGTFWKQGKQFTSWAQEEIMSEESEKAPLLNTGRKLLLQRSQITSMFGAEKLWAKGFTGAKVRMAVFDTGVRADHPHFRNIKIVIA